MSNTWDSSDGQPENEQQPPQPNWARWEAEHGFPVEPPPLEPKHRPAPVDVETARHLWWGVAGLGMLNLVVTLFVVYGQKSDFAQQLVDDVRAQDSSVPLSLDAAESYLTAALVVMILIGAAFGALFVFWVKKMRFGRMWARTLLTMIGTVTVVLAIPQLFGLGVDGGALQVVMTVAGILQGVLAAGAIYLMHRKESNAYFLASRKR
ncbi:hypothetical protein QMK17_01930 [Rhodococcus sp. G-MC3]|uniref:hypothetical protein n=1 Tax=Rhodococcus sp. G-MC3 TaxID=3046209 RepID=UPI0024BA0B73|nr:hypothetical protein [Rhodococcus sp. G-MC3]MDJ0392090.1 hypothetical protein [Rhodococcus sp. G-MC3]